MTGGRRGREERGKGRGDGMTGRAERTGERTGGWGRKREADLGAGLGIS